MSQLVLPHTIDAGTEIVAAEHQLNYVAIRDLINGNLEGGSGVNGNIKADGITIREIADLIVSKGLPGTLMQEGAASTAAGRVTPGAGLVLNYNAGTVWVRDDTPLLASAALMPVVLGASTVNVAANASGNPRLDQVIVTLTGWGTGTVSVLQGTPDVNATLDSRIGAAALPLDAIRLADILMPNGFAGPFVQATHIRDRRQWSAGAFLTAAGTGAGNYTTNSLAAVVLDAANFSRRIEEVSGTTVTVEFMGTWLHNTNNGKVIIGLYRDGVLVGEYSDQAPRALDSYLAHIRWQVVGSTGSHVYEVKWRTDIGTVTMVNFSAAVAPTMVLQEVLRLSSDNAGA
jgi:hypothetical protein